MIAKLDPLGANGVHIMVQVIHKGQPVTTEGLKAFSSNLGTGHVGLLVSSGGFTKDAYEEIVEDSYKHITLWNLEKLFELWVRHYKNIDQNAHLYLPIKAVYFLIGNNVTPV